MNSSPNFPLCSRIDLTRQPGGLLQPSLRQNQDEGPGLALVDAQMSPSGPVSLPIGPGFQQGG